MILGVVTFPALNVSAATGDPTRDTDIKGYLKFQKPDSTTEWIVCRYCKVDIYDDDSNIGAGSVYLGSAVTSSTGYFTFLATNADDSLGVDPFLSVWMDYSSPSSSPVKLVNGAGDVWRFQTGTTWNCKSQSNGGCPSSDSLGWTLRWEYSSTGSLASITSTGRRALWAYEGVVNAWEAFTTRTDGPKVPVASMGKVTVRFPAPIAADQAFYDPWPGGEIRLGSGITSQTIHAHEYGHYAMWVAFNPTLTTSSFPSGDCNGARMNERTNPGCAWKEGWADYVALEATKSSTFRWSNAADWVNLEPNTCSTTSTSRSCTTYPWANGNEVELRVAATLWDLTDSTSDGRDYSWIDLKLSDLWTVLKKTPMQKSFEDFLAAAGATGPPHPADSFNAAAQNNIFAGVTDSDGPPSRMTIRYAYPGMNWNTMKITMDKVGKYGLSTAPNVAYSTANSAKTVTTTSQGIAIGHYLQVCATAGPTPLSVTLSYSSWQHTYKFASAPKC